MPINPLPLVERITRYAVNERSNRPWMNHQINVAETLNRHTALMAVIWKVVDDNVVDSQQVGQGSTERVVFTLTAVSQSRKNAARMSQYLAEIIPYNPEIMSFRVTDSPSPVSIVTYGVTEYNAAAPGSLLYPKLPEQQQLALRASQRHSVPYRSGIAAVRMTSCYNEGKHEDYEPSLDTWKNESIYISMMEPVFTEDEDA